LSAGCIGFREGREADADTLSVFLDQFHALLSQYGDDALSVRDSKPDATAFLTFLSGPDATAVFTKAGFIILHGVGAKMTLKIAFASPSTSSGST
jgi:hypothetical protein